MDTARPVLISRLPSSEEGPHELLREETPSVHEDEEDQLERHRYHDRRKHDHAHGHEYRGDDHIDDDEWYVQEDPYLECDGKFIEYEGRYEDVSRHVRQRIGLGESAHGHEQADVLGIR